MNKYYLLLLSLSTVAFAQAPISLSIEEIKAQTAETCKAQAESIIDASQKEALIQSCDCVVQNTNYETLIKAEENPDPQSLENAEKMIAKVIKDCSGQFSKALPPIDESASN